MSHHAPPLVAVSSLALFVCLAAAVAPPAALASGPSGVAEGQGATDRSVAQTGSPHDFDYFAGAWTTHQRRLAKRGVGSTDWEEFPATLCMTPYLDGTVTVDEVYFPTKGWAGVTVRSFDLDTRQWSIYWISSKSGRVDPPVVGGFDGERGEFHGEDVDGGRPVKVRFVWTKRDHDHATWEQAFSYDGGRSWEVNWTADFLRANAAKVCERGRPRR